MLFRCFRLPVSVLCVVVVCWCVVVVVTSYTSPATTGAPPIQVEGPLRLRLDARASLATAVSPACDNGPSVGTGLHICFACLLVCFLAYLLVFIEFGTAAETHCIGKQASRYIALSSGSYCICYNLQTSSLLVCATS